MKMYQIRLQLPSGNLECILLLCSGYSGANPGYGFHSDYTHGQQYPRGQASPGTGSGFWTGMGTGGVLGYLFGRQR